MQHKFKKVTAMENTTPNDLTKLAGWRLPSQDSRGALNDCSLIIATYRRPAEVIQLLGKIDALADVPGEIVIVDGSPEETLGREARSWGAARRLRFDLVYVRSPKGLTLQRNVGIDISTRDFLFYLDDDAAPLEGYFPNMRRAFESRQDRPVGGVGGSAINEMDRPINRRWRLRLALGLVPPVEPMIYHDCGTSTPTGRIKPFTGVRPVDCMPGAGFALRREVTKTMRFSEFFYGYAYGEDIEMALRVKSKWEVVWSGDARYEHHQAPGGRPTSFSKGRMEVRNRYFIWRRHRPGASLFNRLRFYSDLAFLFLMDLAWFAVRPWKLHALAHALGLAAGGVETLIRPPRFKEPPARRRYEMESAGQPAMAVANSNQ